MGIQTKNPEIQTIQNHCLSILNWLPSYKRAWQRGELLAGLTVLALLIPEGMAYAQIVDMPLQIALYAARLVSLWRSSGLAS